MSLETGTLLVSKRNYGFNLRPGEKVGDKDPSNWALELEKVEPQHPHLVRGELFPPTRILPSMLLENLRGEKDYFRPLWIIPPALSGWRT